MSCLLGSVEFLMLKPLPNIIQQLFDLKYTIQTRRLTILLRVTIPTCKNKPRSRRGLNQSSATPVSRRAHARHLTPVPFSWRLNWVTDFSIYLLISVYCAFVMILDL